MSGLEVLALVPLLLAAAQLIHPFSHGLKTIKAKIKGHKVQVKRQSLPHQVRGAVQNPNHDVAKLAGDATTVQKMECLFHELSKIAGNAQRGWEASNRDLIQGIHYSIQETLQFAESTQVRWDASTQANIRAFVQETRSSRQQLVSFACVTACLAYTLGQAKGENRYLKRMHIFLDEKGTKLQDLESQSWLVALATWPFRSCWTVLMNFGRLIGAVLITTGRVIRMSFGGIAGISERVIRMSFDGIAEVASSPAAMWLASTIHQLLSTAVFLLNYPANSVYDFLTASSEIIGIHRLFIIVPLGLVATARLGCFSLHFWKQILGGRRCRVKHSLGKEIFFVWSCTLSWAVTWCLFAVLGTPESVLELLGAALVILALIEGRVKKCSYVACVHYF